MSDETKTNILPEAPETPKAAQAAETGAETAAKGGGKAKQPAAKPKAEPKPKGGTGSNVLEAVGLEACKRHNLAQVWVTSDGQAFAQEGDAKAHALNLASKETIKVSAQ